MVRPEARVSVLLLADGVGRMNAYGALCEWARHDVVRLLLTPPPKLWSRAPDPPPPPDDGSDPPGDAGAGVQARALSHTMLAEVFVLFWGT